MLKCIQRLLQQHAYGPIMFSSAQAFKRHTCNPLLIMPRYFFDVRDGEGFVKDDEGLELLDIAEAQIEAAETLADMARDLAVRAADPLGHPMAIEVRDGEGRPHFLVGFAFANKRSDA